MKKPLILLAGALLSMPSAFAAQNVLANWTFETSFNSIGGTGGQLSGISPEVGPGTAAGSHANASATWSSPSGNGSAHSFSADHWSTEDYFQFSTPLDLASLLYSGISLSFSQNGSATGPKTFGLAYSTDGVNFTQFGSDYALQPGITWNGSSTQPVLMNFDLSSIVALNTASTLYFRIVDDSPTIGGAINGGDVTSLGSISIDDFTIAGNVAPVPEPSLLALLGLGLGGWIVRRRMK